jgi:hypothetical protein
MNVEEWRSVPDDPDPCSDLGYEMEELKVIESATNAQFIFLPENERHLDAEEFIIVHGDSLCELEP